MKSTVVEDADVVTYVVGCDPGDEAVAALNQFVRSERLEYPTLEAVVTETPAELRTVMRPDIGRALIDVDQTET
jgi:predicted DNA-binding protein with PD1-like motif